jgi:type I restriction enzyme S subunit
VATELFKDFFFYLLSSPVVFRQFQASAAGAVVQNLNSDKVANTLIPLPPLAEQKRIVAKIEELLPYIDRYEKAWSKLEDFNKRFPGDMQKSLLQMAIQGKLVEQRPEEGTGEELLEKILATKNTKGTKKNSRAETPRRRGKSEVASPREDIPDDEKPFDIPESWVWVRFLSVVDIATNLVSPAGHENDRHIAPDNIEKGTGRLLESRTVAEDKVVSSNHRFFKGQLIYSKIRPLLRKVVIAPFDGLCSADMYPLNAQIDSSFLLFYMLSDAFNIQIARAMSSRVKMPKINQEELSKVLLPLPPLAEQKRIVAKLEELLPLCERLK